jgi:hypothetical protein
MESRQKAALLRGFASGGIGGRGASKAVATDASGGTSVEVAEAPATVCERRYRTAAVGLGAHPPATLAALPQAVVDRGIAQVGSEEFEPRLLDLTLDLR